MDVAKTLADLREYRVQLDEAIVALEALARVRGLATSGGSGTHSRSAATRERMAEAQRKRWAASRNAGKVKPGPKPVARETSKSK